MTISVLDFNTMTSSVKNYFMIFLILFLNSTLSYGEEQLSDGDLSIEGDSLENTLDRKLKASGNAVLKSGGKTIKADLIEYDQVSDELYAIGNISIEGDGSSLTGSSIELSIKENIGSIPNATFSSALNKSNSNFNDKLRGSAKMLFLEGEGKKRLQNASITTCDAGQDDWYIKASEIGINNNSQTVDAKDAKLEFKGIPILYSPLVNFSFNDDRKSGFLAPSVGTTSRSGFESSIPYYFNLSPTSDATITPRYLGKRGFQMQGEYRYLDKTYSGTSNLEYMDKDNATNRKNRYYGKFHHKQSLTDNITGGFRMEKVSDDNYFSDMSSAISATSTVNLPQEAYLNYASEKLDINFIAQRFQNLTATSSPYERLPSLTVNYSDEYENLDGFTSYETDFSMSLTQFERNHNFVASSTDKNISGTRFVARPSLAVPLKKSYGYVEPKLTMNIVSYNLDGNSADSKSMIIPTLSLDSGLHFDKKLTLAGNSFVQTLEPRIFYSYTPYKNQEALPMFDTVLTDLNLDSLFIENQFVGGDRVMDSNQFTIAATTRFLDNTGYERLNATLAQRFYLSDRKVLKETQFINSNSAAQSDSSDLFLTATGYINKALKVNSAIQYNPDESTTNRATLRTRYSPHPGKLIDVSYRLIRGLTNNNGDIKQINLAGQWPLGGGWSSIGRYNYDIKKSSAVESLGGFEYDGGCWTSRIVVNRLSLATTEKANYTLFMQIELGGLGSLGSSNDANLFDVLKRNVPGASFTSGIPDQYRMENLK
jgi:LPS-assembly protein